jgi:hypothetical protein
MLATWHARPTRREKDFLKSDRRCDGRAADNECDDFDDRSEGRGEWRFRTVHPSSLTPRMGESQMSKSANRQRWVTLSLGIALLSAATGCQLDVGGQTLPSPQWMLDDVQYFPSGTEFKLSREAAAMQAAKADAAAQGDQNNAQLPGVAPGALPVPGGGGPIPLAPGPAPGP